MGISGNEHSGILSVFSQSSVVRGSESHKMIDLSGNPVLRIYYTSRVSPSCPSPSSQLLCGKSLLNPDARSTEGIVKWKIREDCGDWWGGRV